MGVQDLIILPLQAHHWPDVKRIYEEGILTGNATIETTAPSWEVWDSRHFPDCRIIALHHKLMAGWAALTIVSSRTAYRGVGEVSIYISEKFRGIGIGNSLMKSLIEESEGNNYWTLQANIFIENISSINLHQKFGFREVGIREKFGKHKGRWRDVMLMERRSLISGVDPAF